MINETTMRVFTGSATDFAAANRVLYSNEMAIESDTGIMKKGDGSTAYPSLARYDGGAFRKVKTADETRTATTTLANDASLLFTMAASTKYEIKIRVFFDTVAAGDFKFALSGPASPTLVRLFRKHIDPVALTTLVVASEVAYTASTAVAGGAGTTGGYIEFDIVVHNGSTAGTFAFQWAQNTSDAGNTIVRAGSVLEYKVI